jgi:hypothetical protein
LQPAQRELDNLMDLGTIHETVQKWLVNDIYDTSKFEKTFNFKTQVELSQGLNREVACYRHKEVPVTDLSPNLILKRDGKKRLKRCAAWAICEWRLVF